MPEDDITGKAVGFVGAGVMGIHSALLMARRGAKVTLLERERTIGGVWFYFANDSSRVQVAEPGYRVVPEKLLADFTPKDEVLGALKEAIEEIIALGGELVLEATVFNVLNRGDDVLVEYNDASGFSHALTFDFTILSTGGLQQPRRGVLPNEELFKGDICYGVSGAPDRIDMKGKDVVVLGMGAFAVENARECLFRGARHVTMVARRRNLIFPKLFGYLFFSAEADFEPRTVAEQRQKANGMSLKRKGDLAWQLSQYLLTHLLSPSKVMHFLRTLSSLRAGPLALFAIPYEECGAQDAMPREIRNARKGKGPAGIS
jgi:cation diffusion facilitator CzcD-associated flavoprotein CzcO